MTARPAEFTASIDAAPVGPMERFEWERIVRRVKMPPTTKLVALTLATYADQNGTRVRPGTERLARVTCVSLPTVKRSLAWLREHGFVDRTKQGNRWAKQADEYQLSVPPTLLELDLLSPEETQSLGIAHET
ncbi:hypothetical protein M2275_005784 [Rhodococcus opacus]|nr:hypothetical protein [Rhodococcus opacus]